jgi:hypothetical protein
MGQAITSVNQMVSMAGDLRRSAKVAPEPELSNKLATAAKTLESQAFAKAGITNPNIGKLLDLIA